MGNELEQTKAFLRRIPIFGALEDDGIEALIGLLDRLEVTAGETVTRQGETGRSLYIVRRGEVVVRRAGPCGTAVKVSRLGAGEFFGETTLVEMHAQEVSVVAESPSTLYGFSNRALYTLYQRNPQAYLLVTMNLARELSRRLRKAEARICELAEEAGDERTQIPIAIPRLPRPF